MNQPALLPPYEAVQRWRARLHSWRPAHEGGFRSAEYDVQLCPESDAKLFTTTHHYSGTFPAARRSIGLYHHGALAGTAILSVPTNTATLTNVFPSRPVDELAELGRFVLLDEVPAPAESWTIARVLELASREGIHGIVAFSDPLPRTRLTDGATIFPGHIGHIYKVSSAHYCGRSRARTIHLLPDGTILPERCIQKIRRQEQGHAYAEQLLTQHGASPFTPAEQSASTWLRQALTQAQVRTAWHPGNHRYALITKAKRRYWRLGLPTLPYPEHAQP